MGTGFPAWGDPAAHPWTMGGILAYNTEAVMWADFIADQKPGATVAQLVFNNDFGKAYQTTFEAVAPEKGLEVVETQLHEGTATAIDNEITTLLAANPDVIIGETTGAFCPKLFAGLAAGGFQGIVIISATCASVASFFKPVDPAGNGVYILGQQKDPATPWPTIRRWSNTRPPWPSSREPRSQQRPAPHWLQPRKPMVDTLERAAEPEGGHREIMIAAWATNFQVPLSSAAPSRSTGSRTRTAPSTRRCCSTTPQLAAKADGPRFDVEGESGVFEAS